MTGLEPEKDHILEAACIVTNSSLDPVDDGIDLVIHQEDSILETMGTWCVKHHGESGLTEAVRRSTLTLQQAEDQLLRYVQQHTARGKCPLAGNTVHMDRQFLVKYMPRLVDQLHYRIVDVSTLKELARRWRPDVLRAGERVKTGAHRALDDIKESIAELRIYREQFIRTEE